MVRLEITDIAHDGAGVGRHEGMVVFVPGTAPGDECTAELERCTGRSARGRMVELLVPSPHRAEPVCSALETGCGGCQLQHITYPEQVRLKGLRISAALSRIGRIDLVPERVVPAPTAWYYRTRAQYPVGRLQSGLAVGLYRPGSHQLVPVSRCLIQHPAADDAAHAAREVAAELGWEPYDEVTHRGELRHITTRAVPGGEAMVTLVTRTGRLSRPEEFAARLERACPWVSSVAINVNPRRTNVVFGPHTRVVSGSGFIIQSMAGLPLPVGPTEFAQVNPAQADEIYRLALDWTGPGPGSVVVDAYAGVGPMALAAAARGARVVAIEQSPSAVGTIRSTADRLGLDVAARAGDAGQQLARLADEGCRPQTVILDPPRSGCRPEVLESLLRLGPERIVYVSCNPSTLARDLVGLVSGGYRPLRLVGIDMFPHTAHVETVVLMSRVEN